MLCKAGFCKTCFWFCTVSGIAVFYLKCSFHSRRLVLWCFVSKFWFKKHSDTSIPRSGIRLHAKCKSIVEIKPIATWLKSIHSKPFISLLPPPYIDGFYFSNTFRSLFCFLAIGATLYRTTDYILSKTFPFPQQGALACQPISNAISVLCWYSFLQGLRLFICWQGYILNGVIKSTL